MTPTVTLKISNPNNTLYPTIILRKFFNMVFVEPDGKTFNIYTATVFGGADTVDLSQPQTSPKPKHVPNRGVELEFNYQISYDDDSVANSSDISIRDITDKLLSDDDDNVYQVKNREQIHKFWGDVEKISDQQSLKKLLDQLYGEIEFPHELPTMTQLGNVYFIDDHENRNSHKCIVCKGIYDEIDSSSGYKLALNGNAMPGIEAINWVKTTIRLKCNVLKSKNSEKMNVRFQIQFSDKSDTDAPYTPYYTPDFTWYFAPPCNYVVDESAILKIGKDAMPNKIAPVADDTTVRFKEWRDEGIGERKKSRVTYFREYTKTNPYGFSKKKVSVLLSFVNPGRRGNFQFFLGLIASYLLSFCSDMGRLGSYKDACLKAGLCGVDCKLTLWFGTCICDSLCHLLSLFLPVLVVAVFCSIVCRKDDCFPEDNRNSRNPQGNGDKWAIRLRWFGLVAAALLVLYVNVVWLVIPGMISRVVKTCILNQSIVFLLLITALFGNIYYVVYCLKVKKRNLIDFF